MAELSVAQQTQYSLDEQKVENIGLKETIDRLRLELDELRNTSSPAKGSFGSSGGSMMLKGGARKSFTTLDMELSEIKGDVDDDDQTDAATAVGTPMDDDAFSVGSDGFEETIITTRRRRVSHNVQISMIYSDLCFTIARPLPSLTTC